MTPRRTEHRRRLPALAVPAAVLGAFAGALIAPAAHASVTTAPAPHDRGIGAGLRLVPAQAPAPDAHTVASGDTVYAIAGRYGLRTADVLAWNGLTSASVIHPGDTLRLTPPTPSAAPAPAVPAPPTAGTTHAVVAGDTLFAIAAANGIPLDALLQANGLVRASVIYPGQALRIPGTGPVTPSAPAPAAPPVPASATSPAAVHTVVAGDTLFAIARAHGTSVRALLAANGLGEGAIIYPGQTLRLAPAAPAAPAAAPAPATIPAAGGQLRADLSSEQAANAAMIIRIGTELGVPDRGIAIALATAMVESELRNVTWGDRDSLGLFQQRPSTGWGTGAQVQDAERATRAFYGGPHDPNGSTTRGLLDIPGWEGLPFTQAAQAVQISAFPDRYGQWEEASYRWLEQHR